MRNWCAYMLRCSDGSLYSGCSNDLWRRMRLHRSGRGSKYVRSRLPFVLEWTSRFSDKKSALAVERRLKSLSRKEKEEVLASGAGCRHASASGNPFLQAFSPMRDPDDPFRIRPDLRSDLGFQDFCQEMHKRFSWGVPDEEAIDIVASHGPLVEMGAGLGYWAALLREMGADVLAMDSNVPGASILNPWHPGWVYFTPVQPGTPPDLSRHSKRALFLCWPPMRSLEASSVTMAADCLDHWSGRKLVLVGDPDHIAGSEFHDRLFSEFCLRLYKPLLSVPPAVSDALTIWERR